MNTRLFLILAVLAISVILAGLTGPVRAQSTSFTANLSGGSEVPAVATPATGMADFMLSPDGTSLSYTLSVANISDVTQSHRHLAAVGVNGPVVAWLFPAGPPATLIPGVSNGVLAQGTLTAANLTGILAGQPLSALIDAINAGNAYVNVHTVAHPGGEIRGQIMAR